ncbi:MAG TPA: rhamnulokinase family protein [Acidimicrobiales bacterium]
MATRVFGAVDLGASGGRVVAGLVDGDDLALDIVHRFPNGVVERDGHLRWDFTRLFTEVETGIETLAAGHPDLTSIGIDTWGVDYGVLDADGQLLAEPIAYRDGRTEDVIDDVHARVPPAGLFAHNGLQSLPFTTLYQLVAEQRGPLWADAAHVVLLPDLLAHRLTGELGTEVTNASTTGLLDARTGDWSTDILDRLDIPTGMLPPLEQPGAVRGKGPGGVPVTTVGSHDTASAVVGVPARTERFAYVASGTWSLVGLELDGPVLTDEARGANFTNERGVDDRTRFLRNVGGLWLLQEAMREWSRTDLVPLLDEAAALPAGGPVIDVDDDRFIPPGGMPERIAVAADHPLMTDAETVRCIVDSLASAYARTVHQGAELAGAGVDVIHIVGGGSQNELLCQATADLAGLPVIAGPVEATALGNIVVQARAHGAMPASLEAMRARIAAVTPLRRYDPS